MRRTNMLVLMLGAAIVLVAIMASSASPQRWSNSLMQQNTGSRADLYDEANMPHYSVALNAVSSLTGLNPLDVTLSGMCSTRMNNAVTLPALQTLAELRLFVSSCTFRRRLLQKLAV